MLKKILILIIMVASLANIACKKCSNITTYKFPAATEQYFGMYKQGNWWVYQNQDSTKKDSIYLTDVNSRNTRDRTLDECLEWQLTTAKVSAKYLRGGRLIELIYEATPDGANFNIYKEIQTDATDIDYQGGSFNSNDVLKISSIFQNGKLYKDIVKLQSLAIYYAPNIGIIRWEAGTDTFTLKSYYLQ